MLTIESCQNFLLAKVGEGDRYNHSLEVAAYASNLAVSFNGVNIEAMKIAALLHDIAKSTPLKEASAMLSEDLLPVLEYPSVVHSYAGAIIAQKELGIKDPLILDAIMFHTTGKIDMSIFSLILYISDFAASIKEENETSLVQDLMDMAIYNLYEAALSVNKEKLISLINRQILIHPDSFKMYNWLLQKKV